MLNDHVIVSPVLPVAGVTGGKCEKGRCTAAAAYTIEEMASDGYGGYGEAVDTGNYCRMHALTAVAERL